VKQYREVFVDRRARALFLSAAVSGLGDWIGLAGLVLAVVGIVCVTLGEAH